MNLKKYRRRLIGVFIIYICFFIYYLSNWFYKSIPDVWRMTAGQESRMDFNLPLTVAPGEEVLAAASINGEKVPSGEIRLSQPLAVNIEEAGTYKVALKWMGIHLKDVEVNVIDEVKVVPLGMPVGIYIRTKGVMVLGIGAITDYEGNRTEPAADILQSGDYILEADGKEILSIDNFTQILETWKGGEMHLKIQRSGNTEEVRITPVRTTESVYKIGAWIRQDAQGIGTLSYVDANNHFGALGHGITDVDTSLQIDISGGRLYESNILSIVKGQSGTPGEMVGNIDYKRGEILGSIQSNNDYGIFGILEDGCELYDESQALPVGMKQEIRKGPAVIRCCVEGETKEYEVEIESIDLGSFAKNRDMVIKITDEALLNTTNGIIQGMSGSPIIQDGKFIGAVTHVFVNDSTKGYGIFAERMLDESQKQ